MRQWNDSWVRIAGFPENIKNGNPHHWRGLIEKTGDEISFANGMIKGFIDGSNRCIGSDPSVPDGGLAAWISYFGDIVLDERGILSILLKQGDKPLNSVPFGQPSKIFQRIWVYLAVSKKRLRNGNPRHWRIFIGKNSSEIPLRNFIVLGKAHPSNHITESVIIPDLRGMIAWVRHFGDCILYEDDVVILKHLDTV